MKNNQTGRIYLALMLMFFSLQEYNAFENRATTKNQNKISGRFFMPKQAEIQSMANSTNLPDKLWEGWLKFFHYDDSEKILKPYKFFINDFFYNQKVLNTELGKLKDDKGYLNIPTKYYFYAQLYKTKLVIFSSRDIAHQKLVESFDLNYIKYIRRGDLITSPIQNLGSFNEGYCMNIDSKIPRRFDKDFTPEKESNNAKSQNWVICFDTDSEKETFINSMIAMKLKIQDELEKNKPTEKEDPLAPVDESRRIERYRGSDANQDIDGYLILLNDCKKI